MKIEQQIFRDQLAATLVVEISSLYGDPENVVERAFTLADLTIERITKDLLALKEADKQQSVDEALVKAEQRAAEARDFEERRKGGGVNVIETDDLHDVLAALRSIIGRN